MADRYWVGGTGTWGNSQTTNWSATSGGTAGASVPTASDNVYFDANSNVGTGAFTVTMANEPRLCNDFTASGLDGTMTLTGVGLTVSGSLDWPATNFSPTYSGTTTFNATTTGKTITARVAFPNYQDVVFDGAGGGWTLGFALEVASLNGTLILTRGTFSTSGSNYSVTANDFESSNSNTRTLNLNGSTVTLTGVLGTTCWDMSTSTNATLNAGTSTSLSAGAFEGGGLTYSTVVFSSEGTSISGANTFTNLTIDLVSPSTELTGFSFYENQTITGTFSGNGSTTATKRLFIFSDQVGVARTLTCAAITLMSDVDFRDITIAGAASPLSSTRLGNCGGNTGITFNAGVNKYWNLAAGGSWSSTAWALSSGGAVSANNFPLAQDTVLIENTGLNTSATVTINGSYNIGTLDTSTRTNAMTLASSTNNPTFYGNFTYGSGVTPTGTGTYSFSNRATKTLNSGGKTFTQPVTINAPGGGIQLLTNNLTMSSTRTATLTNGTLDLNGQTLTVGTAFTTSTGTKDLTFNGGTLVCPTATSIAFNNAAPTGFTTTAGTGTGTISMTAATAKTFVGGGSTFNCTLNQGGAGTLTVTGSNTFSNITNTYKSTGATSILFTAATTNTFADWTASGEATRLLTIGSVTTSNHTLVKTGIVNVDYLSISRSTATGGGWFAGANSTDGGNNTGWVFSAATGVSNGFLLFLL